MESSRSLALIDANLNRSREGLRVLDDIARFLLADGPLCTQIKQLRHDLVTAEGSLKQVVPDLLHHRNVDADVGTAVSVDGEMSKSQVAEIAAANIRRVQEAMRSLEEFGKLHCTTFAEQTRQLRYRTYQIEQQLAQACDTTQRQRRARLESARVYVLITESLCRLPWKQTVAACITPGSILQLREKGLSAGELIRRSRWFVSACREAGCLAIINDRPDIAAIASADGVHLGQTDAAVADVRQLVTAPTLIGLSTHAPAQLTAAMQTTADYFGAGPVFSSGTKQFDKFAGLDYLRCVAQTADRPWFAIGGISIENVADVVAAGATRVAVCGAVIGTDAPGQAIADLAAALPAP
ncbi:MAG: thiamine phosphate synthase [Planctomycetaceae bacterium]|nr:thiamine phosphate synthase [Planctomycetaceae bacterium]